MMMATKKKNLAFSIPFWLFCFARKASVSAFLSTISSNRCQPQQRSTSRPSVRTALFESPNESSSWQEVARKIVSLNTQLSESHLELQRNRVEWMKEKLNLVRNVADFQSSMGRNMQEEISKECYGAMMKEFDAELQQERAQMDQTVNALQKEIYQMQYHYRKEQQKTKALETQMENWKAELLVLWKESEAEKKNLRGSLDEKTKEIEVLKAKEQQSKKEAEEQTRQIEALQEQLKKMPDQVEPDDGTKNKSPQAKDPSAKQVKLLQSEIKIRDKQRNDHVWLSKQNEMEKSEMRGLLLDQGRQIRELKAQLYHAKKARLIQDDNSNSKTNNTVDAKATVPDNKDDNKDPPQDTEVVGQWE